MKNLPTTTFNQLANVSNPYQGKSKKVLCCCSAGILRSPTAANVLHKTFGYNTRSCGVDVDFALIPISEALIEWSDEIVVMNSYQKIVVEDIMLESKLLNKKINARKIINLDIEDSYSYMELELQEIILQKYSQQPLA